MSTMLFVEEFLNAILLNAPLLKTKKVKGKNCKHISG